MTDVDLLSKLISISSVSGNESEIINFIASWLTNYSLKPIIHENNLYVHIKGTNSNKAFILNSHVDTVSAGDLGKWTHKPTSAFITKNKIIGLGASDTKGGVATLMQLLAIWSKNVPPCDLYFCFVVNEELDGLGTKQFIKWFINTKNYPKYKEISAVVCEPTSLKSLEIGHKGNAFVKVTVKGQSGHGSRPWLIKKHAILESIKIIDDIDNQVNKWSKLYSDSIIGSPSISLTGIKAGSDNCPNKFPDDCVLQLDIRTTPKLHPKLNQELDKWLSRFKVKYEYMVEPAPFGYCSKDEKIVACFGDIIPNIKILSTEGAADQCFFTQQNIPAVIFGPGEKKQSHQANEFCYPNQIPQAVTILNNVINKWA